MVKLTSHNSPSRTRAKPSLRLRFPLRIDLISVPLSAMPTSSDSSFSYSKRARRLSNAGSFAALFVSPAAAALRATLDFIRTLRHERAFGGCEHGAVFERQRRFEVDQLAAPRFDAAAHHEALTSGIGLRKRTSQDAVTAKSPCRMHAYAITSSSSIIATPPCATPRQPCRRGGSVTELRAPSSPSRSNSR